VGVSLDGPQAYHDRFRTHVDGSGSHARVVEALGLLARHGVAYNILSVINRVTGSHGAEIYDYLVGEGYTYLQFIPCVETDPITGQVTEFSVQPEQFGDFCCAVFDRWYNGGDPQVSIRDFDSILGVYLGQPASVCCYQEQCGGYLVVEYNGDLYPCDFYVRDDLRLGNIADLSLGQAFASRELSGFAALKADPRPECAACAWRLLCQQGCSRFVGLFGKQRHYLCRGYQQFFAHSYEGFMALRSRLEPASASPSHGATIGPVLPVGRNDPCPCGSGKKLKQCCAAKRPGWLRS
jgi:uncharacterized protein